MRFRLDLFYDTGAALWVWRWSLVVGGTRARGIAMGEMGRDGRRTDRKRLTASTATVVAMAYLIRRFERTIRVEVYFRAAQKITEIHQVESVNTASRQPVADIDWRDTEVSAFGRLTEHVEGRRIESAEAVPGTNVRAVHHHEVVDDEIAAVRT